MEFLDARELFSEKSLSHQHQRRPTERFRPSSFDTGLFILSNRADGPASETSDGPTTTQGNLAHKKTSGASVEPASKKIKGVSSKKTDGGERDGPASGSGEGGGGRLAGVLREVLAAMALDRPHVQDIAAYAPPPEPIDVRLLGKLPCCEAGPSNAMVLDRPHVKRMPPLRAYRYKAPWKREFSERPVHLMRWPSTAPTSRISPRMHPPKSLQTLNPKPQTLKTESFTL